MLTDGHSYMSRFAPGDRVLVDGADDLKASVETIGFDLRGEVVCVEYWAESGRLTVWLPPSRLRKVDV